MARTIEKLTALAGSKLTRPGLYSDGGGLYLRVTKFGAKSWVFHYMLDRRPREMGLGANHAVSLSASTAQRDKAVPSPPHRR